MWMEGNQLTYKLYSIKDNIDHFWTLGILCASMKISLKVIAHLFLYTQMRKQTEIWLTHCAEFK